MKKAVSDLTGCQAMTQIPVLLLIGSICVVQGLIGAYLATSLLIPVIDRATRLGLNNEAGSIIQGLALLAGSLYFVIRLGIFSIYRAYKLFTSL